MYGDISMRLAAAVSHSSLSLSVPSAVAMAQSHPSEEERPFTYCWIGVAMAARMQSVRWRLPSTVRVLVQDGARLLVQDGDGYDNDGDGCGWWRW